MNKHPNLVQTFETMTILIMTLLIITILITLNTGAITYTLTLLITLINATLHICLLFTVISKVIYI
jgi:hypothetical protein